MKTIKNQEGRDARINELHAQAARLWPKIEGIIDELQMLGPHSADGDNAVINVREWLGVLSKRGVRK